jgi:hypothetical protein
LKLHLDIGATMQRHEILGGKVQLYRRAEGGKWQCSASVAGKQRRSTTKEDSLSLAKQIAEDWYLGLRGKDRAGLLKTEKTFRRTHSVKAADQAAFR